MVLNHNDGMSDICIEKSVTYGFNTKPPLDGWSAWPESLLIVYRSKGN